jgi:hypothetical protein
MTSSPLSPGIEGTTSTWLTVIVRSMARWQPQWLPSVHQRRSVSANMVMEGAPASMPHRLVKC